ncbi:MAG TPA: hypothetical protein VFR31_21660, partial [Thermoanaerobaculia bacterium]|nr:hypothetical protein [Thermoanaerobaculia bacterium]
MLATLGVAVALLPAMIHPRLWTFWPVFLGIYALALGMDALLAPRREVFATVELPETLSVGREGQTARIRLRL